VTAELARTVRLAGVSRSATARGYNPLRGTRGSDAFGACLQAVAGYRWKRRLPVV